MLSLCSVTACLLQPCVATTVSYTTQRRKCCLLPVPPLSPATLDMTFCLWRPQPHLPPADRTSITSRHCEKRRGGNNERRKIKVIVGFRDRLSSDSSSSPTPCQHTTSVPPSSPPSDHDDLSASSLSAPLRPPNRQLLHIPLSSSSAESTLLVCLFNARSVGTSRRRSDISTFIQDNNINIMLLTETWLRPAGVEAKIADLVPPGYSVLS